MPEIYARFKSQPAMEVIDIEDELRNDSRFPDDLLGDTMGYLKEQIFDNRLSVYELLTNIEPPRRLIDIWPVVSEVLESLI